MGAALAKIARASSGDARAAVHLLRQAAIKAESEGKAVLDASPLPGNSLKPRDLRNERQLGRLSPHHQLIHGLVGQKGSISASALWPLYGRSCRKAGLEPVASRAFSKYVKELSERGVLRVEKLGSGRLLGIRR